MRKVTRRPSRRARTRLKGSTRSMNISTSIRRQRRRGRLQSERFSRTRRRSQSGHQRRRGRHVRGIIYNGCPHTFILNNTQLSRHMRQRSMRAARGPRPRSISRRRPNITRARSFRPTITNSTIKGSTKVPPRRRPGRNRTGQTRQRRASLSFTPKRLLTGRQARNSTSERRNRGRHRRNFITIRPFLNMNQSLHRMGHPSGPRP